VNGIHGTQAALNRPDQEVAHAQDSEPAMIVTFPLTMNITRQASFEHHPQVEDQEGHASMQQAQGWICGRSTGPDTIHLAITGLDPNRRR
jgi:hypothetical protein